MSAKCLAQDCRGTVVYKGKRQRYQPPISYLQENTFLVTTCPYKVSNTEVTKVMQQFGEVVNVDNVSFTCTSCNRGTVYRCLILVKVFIEVLTIHIAAECTYSISVKNSYFCNKTNIVYKFKRKSLKNCFASTY